MTAAVTESKLTGRYIPVNIPLIFTASNVNNPQIIEINALLNGRLFLLKQCRTVNIIKTAKYMINIDCHDIEKPPK